MFAYCENDPINSLDSTGESPFGILDWLDRKIIHGMVQIKCSVENRWSTEVFVKSTKGKGFVDLLDPIKNQYYEIKSEVDAKRSRTARQMAKYDNATIQNSYGNRNKYYSVNIGETISRGNYNVVGFFQYGIYDVSYRLNSPGLIEYTIDLNWNRAARYATLASLSILLVLFPELAPTVIPGLADTI